MLNASEVEMKQNAEPTDWSKHDADLAGRSDWNANRFAEDGKLHVRFFLLPVIDQDASDKAQRPIYVDTEYVEIMIPGDKHNKVVEPVDHVNKRRFASRYDQFKQGMAEQIIGTPLKLSKLVTDSQIKELEFFHVRTVEQLAGMNDGICSKMMGAGGLKQAAQKYLDKANSVATLRDEIEAKFMAKEKQMQEELASLREQVLRDSIPRKDAAKAAVR